MDGVKLPMELSGHGLTMDTAKPEDADEMFEFMVEHYLPGAPMRQIYLWDECEDNKRPQWRLDETRQRLRQPYSLVVCCPVVKISLKNY